MIRGFFSLIFRLITLAILLVIGTAIYIVYDGLNDSGDRADVAVVPGTAVRHDGTPGAILRGRLDEAIALYRNKEFPLIIVSGATQVDGYDEPAAMSKYLMEHQVPAVAIIQDKVGAHTSTTGMDVANIMRQRNLHSVMIVTNYYHITRTKLALKHAGIHDIGQAHVGVVRKEDAFMLAREVIALYYYVGKFYIMPATEQARIDARTDGDKVKIEADKARDSLNKKIENLPK